MVINGRLAQIIAGRVMSHVFERAKRCQLQATSNAPTMAMTPMAVFASSNMPDTNTKSNVDSVDGVVQDEVFVVAKRTRATPAKSATATPSIRAPSELTSHQHSWHFTK